MLRVIVDSGSSIKENEKELYNVEILPLKILLGNKEYSDGVDLSMEEFYDKLINEKMFPKTSLPSLGPLEEKVNEYTSNGDDVIILPISSKISGTYNAIRLLFEGNSRVHVIDTLSAASGVRLIVNEINKYRNESIEFILKRIKKLIPRIKIMAIPATLEYLFRGGRLSRLEFMIGSVLHIKPVIGIKDGKVTSIAKKRTLKQGMQYIINALKELRCDKNHEIIAAYTYNKENVDKLIEMTDDEYKNQIKVYDNLDPAIACHWGPNAFGYIFVSGE